MPLYLLGLMGATRRMQHYDDPTWQPLMIIALAGAILILIGIVLMAVQLFVSIRDRNDNRDTTGDPWNGRSLEWSTTSPPPPWNFATLPEVDGIDAFWKMKQQEHVAGRQAKPLEAIEIPKNSMIGITISFFAVIMDFALIWHIWWMAVIGILGILGASLVFAWRTSNEIEVLVDELAAEGAQA